MVKQMEVNRFPKDILVITNTVQVEDIGPKYAHKMRLRVEHAHVCVYDMHMRYAQRANSLVFMS